MRCIVFFMISSLFEQPVDNAPVITLNNGNQCIPQHYLVYQHTLASVQSLVYDIDFDDRFPVFVNKDNNELTIQIGIIGVDNYKSCNEIKIVYGRKWRVEPSLPTSEIIQTVFLAIRIAH